MTIRLVPRIDPDTMVWVSLGIHLGWAHALFSSPGLFESLPIYQMFSNLMHTENWAACCLIVGCLLAAGLR